MDFGQNGTGIFFPESGLNPGQDIPKTDLSYPPPNGKYETTKFQKIYL
jgi:hypothetical protein